MKYVYRSMAAIGLGILLATYPKAVANQAQKILAQSNPGSNANQGKAQTQTTQIQGAWWQNPGYWSFGVSLLALIVSWEPKIRAKFGSLKIRIKTPDQFVLYNVFGNLYINIALDINNFGDKTASISKIVCLIQNKSDRKQKLMLPVRTYHSNISTGLPEYGFLVETSWTTSIPPRLPTQSTPDLLFGTIYLKPGESWTKAVTCYNLLTREEEKRLNQVVSNGKENILRKSDNSKKKQSQGFFRNGGLSTRISPPPPFLLSSMSMDDTAYSEIRTFCTGMLKREIELVEGGYRLFIAAHSEKETLCVWEVEFQLYEQNIQDLLDFENYKYGRFYSPKRVYLRAERIDRTPEESLKEYNNKLISS
ncbi:hypothetical protein A6770_04815 [Nostoc minutum NIES-26]|uniref:Uncharacterized protein n=1 Tax=Nostoc minutum NIES-26 TaxID=1844469 RepID=A0A367QFA1_9NOSO|nr:hypothetical protein A6770_04815 [Nostoc minutum NIES-26]